MEQPVDQPCFFFLQNQVVWKEKEERSVKILPAQSNSYIPKSKVIRSCSYGYISLTTSIIFFI